MIFSWLIAMSIFNTQNRIIIAILWNKTLTDPLLNPIRNFLPNLGGIDISPVVLILILYFIRNLLYEYFYKEFHLIMSDTKIIDGKSNCS